MAQAPVVGKAWGCPSCGAHGPLFVSPCPSCAAEISPVVLAGRHTAAYLYNEALGTTAAGFYSESVELLEQAVDVAGPDPGILALLGLLYHQVGRVAEALGVWAQAGKDGPHADWVRQVNQAPETAVDLTALTAYNEALNLAQRERWDEALAALGPATGPGSRLALAFVVQGLALWVVNRVDEAQEAWHRAIELDPSVPGLQVCLVALVEALLLVSRREVLAAALAAPEEQAAPVPVAPVPAAAAEPAAPAPGARLRWIPAALAALVALGSVAAAYQYTRIRVTAAEERATASARAAGEAEAGRVQADAAAVKAGDAARTAQGAAAQADAAAKQAAAREASTLRLLSAANPAGRAEDLEKLLAAIAEARREGVTVPEWLDRPLSANRTAAAVERYFEGYRAFMADQYAKAIPAFEASLKLDSLVYCADDAAYLAARSAELAGQFSEAVRWYERVIAEFPDSPYQDDARYFGARAAAAGKDPARAALWYKELLARFPGSGYDYEAQQALKAMGQ